MMNDPTMDALLQVARGGWASMDQAQGEFDAAAKRLGNEQQIEADRQAAIVHEALSTPAGQALLHLLIEKSLLAPATAQEQVATTADAYALESAKRQGRNSIVLMLIGMMQYAAGQKPIAPTIS